MTAPQPIPQNPQDPQRALIRAIFAGDIPAVMRLFDAGVDPNGREGEEPIAAAVAAGNLKLVDLLLQRGVNSRITDDTGASLLHIACALGYSEVAHRLLVEGLAPTSRDRAGRTPLHYAVAGARNALFSDTQSCIRTLISHGANLEVLDCRAMTPCLVAASTGDRELFEELEKLGADPLARDCMGRSAHDLALERAHERMAVWLAEHYPDTVTSSPARSSSPSP